jgi:hypothetical protein
MPLPSLDVLVQAKLIKIVGSPQSCSPEAMARLYGTTAKKCHLL